MDTVATSSADEPGTVKHSVSTLGGRTIRPATEADWPEIVKLDDTAFNWDTSAEWAAVNRERTEIDRMRCAWQDDILVGTTAALSLRMTVPGGQTPTAGVTFVAVLPTHRRRGILRELMRHQLDELYENGGEAVAALTASEPAIYGRFGYGLASREVCLSIERSASALVAAAGRDPALVLRFADPAQSLERTNELYAGLLPTRPGMIARSPAWQRSLISEAAEVREGVSTTRCVLATEGERLRGYARYRVSKEGRSQVRVREVYASDPHAYAELWRFLLDLDLTSGAYVSHLALDDPLLRLLADLPGARAEISDGVYVRLVDLPRALAARTYSRELDVVLAVEDPFCPWNEGRWRLCADQTGSRCDRTTAPADLRLDVRELGAVYLGDASLRGLGAAGLVSELRPGALAAASTAFAHDPLPFLSTRF
jgi:predicted acetyltransferase